MPNLDLDDIRGRVSTELWAGTQAPGVDSLLSGDIPAMIAKIEALREKEARLGRSRRYWKQRAKELHRRGKRRKARLHAALARRNAEIKRLREEKAKAEATVRELRIELDEAFESIRGYWKGGVYPPLMTKRELLNKIGGNSG